MAQLLAPGSILAMTDQAADRLIKLDSGDAALLYLHLLRRGSPEGLRWPEERKRAALKQLQDQGLASLSLTAAPAEPEEPPEAPPPEYALEDINAALGDRSSAFPALADEVERRLGKKLTANDLKVLYTLYDHLALPAEVICLLVNWCIEEMDPPGGVCLGPEGHRHGGRGGAVPPKAGPPAGPGGPGAPAAGHPAPAFGGAGEEVHRCLG